MARDFLPRQDVQIADPSGRTTTPFYVWMQSLERAFGALDVDLAALLEQIEQLKPGQKLTIDGAMSVIVANVDGTITISLDGDNDSPGGNWYYGTNESGVRGFWPIADGVSGGYSITKAVDYGPYDFQGELDTPDELPYPAVIDDAYLINGDLWVGVDDGGDDGPGWDNLGPAPTTAVLSLINDEATPDPTHYYGTDAAGDKGWHPVSDAVEAATGELTKTVDGYGVTMFGLPDVTPTPGGTLQRYGFDAKGRRIEEEAADTDDLAEGSSNLYFTDARADARITAQKGQPNGLATLDADAKLEANQLPALAITDTFVVNTEAAMLALDAQQGDVAVRTDEQKSYILTADPASTLGNWQELLTPTGTGGTVTSVALSVPTGLTVSGSPITSSGTITVAYDTGYQGYTSAEASKLSGIAAGATVGADWSANLSNIPANISSWAGIAPSDKADTAALADYLPLAGGTMAGAVSFPNNSVAMEAPGGAKMLTGTLGHTWLMRAGEAGGNALATQRVDGTTTMVVGDTGITWEGNYVWHAGNFDPATKANDSDVVKTSGNQSVGGVKTFTQPPRIASNAPGIWLDETDTGKSWLWVANNDTIYLGEGDGTLANQRILIRAGAKRVESSSSGLFWDGNTVWHTGNLADSGWTSISVGSGWSATNLARRRFGTRVKLRGAIENTSGTRSPGTIVLTLPAGYRPSTPTMFLVPTLVGGAGDYRRVAVGDNGDISLPDGLPGGVTFWLDGIDFYTD